MTKRHFVKNLIFILIVAILGMVFIQMPVYAAEESITDIINLNVAGMYYIFRIVCIIILIVVAIGGFAYMFIAKTGEATALFRRIALYVIVGLVAVVFLTYIISALFAINDMLINVCMNLAETISGIRPSLGTDSYGELSLYDSAITKAYELRASSGFLGMIMYAALIFFTVRFFIIYLKRYVNILILIVVSPWVIVRHSMLRAFRGTKGKIGLWTKEMIYNIYIQSVHAFLYSICMALTVSLSGVLLNYVGMILTLVVFAAMSSVERIIRKLFNCVGGSSSVKTLESSKLKEKANEKIEKGSGALASGTVDLDKKAKKAAGDVKNGAIKFKDNVKAMPDNIKNKATDAKNKVKAMPGEIKDKAADIKNDITDKANEVKDKAREIPAEVKESAVRLKNTVKEMPGKIKNNVKNKIRIGKRKVKDYSYNELRKIKKHIKKTYTYQNVQAVKTINRYYKYYKKREEIQVKIKNGTATKKEIELASQFEDKENINEDVSDMEEKIKGSKDLVAVLYRSKGAYPFVVGVCGGSSHLGIRILKDSKDLENSLNKDYEDLKRLSDSEIEQSYSNETETNENEVNTNRSIRRKTNKKKHKKYTFQEFTAKTTELMTRYLLLREIVQDPIYAIIKVKALIKERDVKPTGRVRTNNEANNSQAGAVSGEEQGTIHYRSTTKKEDLIKLKGQIKDSFNDCRELVNSNNWTNYVSCNNEVRRRIAEETEYQAKKDEENYNNIYSGVVVLTAMQHNVALENVDIRNDKELQKDMIDNLSMFNINQEEEKMNTRQKESAIKELEDKIQSLTTDDKDTYYNMVVDFDKAAKEQGIKLGNTSTESNAGGTETVSEEPVNFSNNTQNTSSGNVNNNANETEESVNFSDNTKNSSSDNNNINEAEQQTEQQTEEQKEAFKDTMVNLVEDVTGIDSADKKINNYSRLAVEVSAKILKEDVKENLKETKSGIKEWTIDPVIEGAKETLSNYGVNVGGGNKHEESDSNVNDQPNGRNSASGGDISDESKDNIIVFVEGEVRSPGKVLLKKGREYVIENAINAAGGVTEDADLDAINLGAKVVDGMKIYVPSINDKGNDENEISEEDLNTVIETVMTLYISEKNIKDCSSLRLPDHQTQIIELVHDELESLKKNADEKMIIDLIEENIAKLEKEKEERKSRETIESLIKDLDEKKAVVVAIDRKKAAQEMYLDQVDVSNTR